MAAGLLAGLGATCIYKLTALRAKLADPAAILCLGNGPSSEESTVKNQDFTVLFRVNYQWQDRDFARNPAVIFTADPDLPPQNTAAVLVFPTRPDANRILRAHCLRGRPPRQGYAVFPELIDAGTWDFRPTNGALMIAAAVALQPRRIVVAGIDLYRHPAGRYPGDASAPNAYDAIHSRATDVAFIRASLARFDGELVLLGDQLPRAVS